MRVLLFLLLLMLAAHADRKADLRQHALAAPKQAEKSLATLAAYLQKPARSDTEKAFVTYCWVVSRLRYDMEGVKQWPRPDQSPARVFAKRRGVCEGYSRLYSDLVGRMGLECYHVSGLSRTGPDPDKRDHVWDVVYADGGWHLVDTTWANDPQDESFFFTDPATLRGDPLPSRGPLATALTAALEGAISAEPESERRGLAPEGPPAQPPDDERRRPGPCEDRALCA